MAHFFLMQGKMDEAWPSSNGHQLCLSEGASLVLKRSRRSSLPSHRRRMMPFHRRSWAWGTPLKIKLPDLTSTTACCICEVAAVTKIQSVHRASQIRSVYHAVVAAVA